MIEDKLSHDERLRLEALSQAVAYSAMVIPQPEAEVVVSNAKKFEQYLWEGKK